VHGLKPPVDKKTGARGAGFSNCGKRITSFRLSFLQQVLLGLQERPPQQVRRALQVRVQQLVLQAQAQGPLLSCHRQ
jgi:hypothetical protein